MSLFALLAIARLTNMLLFYTLRTTAMEPTIQEGENIFLSKLVNPDRFDIIAFHRFDSLFGKVNWVYRVCGVPDDMVEIKNGVLYVNGTNADSPLISITGRELEEKGIAGTRHILPMGEADHEIQRVYQQPWNQDHFGPVKVPPGKYFLMGDNRHNAMDSRYIGFVDRSSFLGTLIW